ncbi:MAG TPA: CPBP family intramembrane glutamic endopeptidase [Candidatus Binatus sp.]|jgi:membrane protease YdiL (CAAX protease family)|nr:CPBP family intramembrane glutamic endopeptidase [Candidatus Binatus sp.]
MSSGPIVPETVAPTLRADLPPRSVGRKIFRGPNGVRAGWRFILYALLFAGLVFLFQRILKFIPSFVEIVRAVQREGILTPEFEFIFESTVIAAALVAAGLMARFENRPFGVYGLPVEKAFGKLFWQGVLWGLLFESAAMLIISALGGFSFGNLALSGLALVKFASLWAIGFVMVGIAEEFTFRGYTQFTLSTGIGFWPSAVLLSAAFGAIHLGNAGEGWVGALSVAVFGLFACFTLKRTGNLWFAIGFHAASDYAETFLFSTPDSGLLAQGHLLNSSFHGPRWLTGGTIGPEGSLIDFAVFAVAFMAFAKLYPSKKNVTAL